jgi:uncharacterized membrane protein (DUF4010 family)
LNLDPAIALRLLVALGIGLLVGAERERRRDPADEHREAAGLRTFALVALLGGLTTLIDGPVPLAIAGAFTVGGVLAAYFRSASRDPGLTTEAALVVVLFLGVVAMSRPALAAATATVITALLAARQRIHGWVRESLSAVEFRDALWLLGAALVVLPLAPNRDFAGFFNPFTVWRLVVLAMALQAAGHVALRLAGASRGLPLAGFLGGFVSSTATIAAMAARAKRTPPLFAGALAAAVLSNVATVSFLAIVLAATNREVLVRSGAALAAAGVAAVAFAAFFTAKAWRQDADDEAAAPLGRPFDFRVALVLAATVSTILAVATWLERRLGASGGLVGVALGGLADAQAAATSAASLTTSGSLSADQGALGVLVALSTNSVSKLVAAWSAGTPAFAWRLSLGLLWILAGAWGAWALVA